jgi:hypothetical protein
MVVEKSAATSAKRKRNGPIPRQLTQLICKYPHAKMARRKAIAMDLNLSAGMAGEKQDTLKSTPARVRLP